MLQGSCASENHVSSPTDEAVEAFFASMQAEKVDISEGLQQRVEEDDALVEMVLAQDQGMSIGCGVAGSEGVAAEIKEGMGGVSNEGSPCRHDEGKVYGTAGPEGSAGSIQLVKSGLDDGIATEQRKMPAGACVRDA